MSKIDHTTFQDVSHLLNDVKQANVLSSSVNDDPDTPIFSIKTGAPVRFRAVEPTGHQRQHRFMIYGHSWFHESWVNNSTVIWRPGVDPAPQSMTIGTQGGHTARRHWNIVLPSAGEVFKVPGITYTARRRVSTLRVGCGESSGSHHNQRFISLRVR
jgi:hypothetical protein